MKTVQQKVLCTAVDRVGESPTTTLAAARRVNCKSLRPTAQRNIPCTGCTRVFTRNQQPDAAEEGEYQDSDCAEVYSLHRLEESVHERPAVGRRGRGGVPRFRLHRGIFLVLDVERITVFARHWLKRVGVGK
jgi:hypothetical protein